MPHASQLSDQNTPENWYRLRLFNYFRSLLALLFITIYFNGWLENLIPSGNSHTTLFIVTTSLYLIFSFVMSYAMYHRKPALETQVIIHTLVDISCIITLMHATGGVRTGLGMLLIVTIAMTSLFLKRRAAIFFASVAALAVITEQVYSVFTLDDYNSAFTQAGLLGGLIFISAFLSTYTARRLKETERLAEAASAELETIVQMNEHIIKSMRTGIMVIKNNGVVSMANNAALELLGNISIHTGDNLSDISPDLYQRFVDWNNNTIQNHQPIPQPQGLPDIQPGFSHIDTPTNNNNKDEGRTLIFLEDATQLTQRFQQVKLASLGRLTASIAHEIRNPLAAINHAGQLLGESTENEADKKLTGIINTQAKRLNGIVENVLQLSRQQRGTPEAIHLYDWLQAFRDEFISSNTMQAYQIHIKIRPRDIEILFDSSQLHQVIWNLCMNAINHSGMDISNVSINIKGGIDDSIEQPYIDIIDNGPGIDSETLTNIFDPFFTTSASGTGLGLYITKEVVETNRAKIRHIAPPTGGTCFRIYFQQVH